MIQTHRKNEQRNTYQWDIIVSQGWRTRGVWGIQIPHGKHELLLNCPVLTLQRKTHIILINKEGLARTMELTSLSAVGAPLMGILGQYGKGESFFFLFFLLFTFANCMKRSQQSWLFNSTMIKDQPYEWGWVFLKKNILIFTEKKKKVSL